MNRTSRFNFTKTGLAALPNAAPGRRDTHFDTRTRGLTMVVTAAGRKTFYLRRKVEGRSERIHIGRFRDDLSVEQARARAGEINASIGRGENPAEARRDKRAEMTLDVRQRRSLDGAPNTEQIWNEAPRPRQGSTYLVLGISD